MAAHTAHKAKANLEKGIGMAKTNDNNKKKTNKTIKVIEHLKNHGSITSLEAIDMYGATRLSAIIFRLRGQGYNIETHSMPFIDRYGNSAVYGKYVLVA